MFWWIVQEKVKAIIKFAFSWRRLRLAARRSRSQRFLAAAVIFLRWKNPCLLLYRNHVKAPDNCCCLMTATIDLRWVISYSLCRNHVQALDKVAKHTWVGPRVRLGVTLERTKPSAQTGVVDCGSCTWVEVILLWLLLEKLFCFCYNCKLWGFNSYCANSSVKSC